ncbi:ABC transporter substrate-binding protein [bacterium]|nr:MAG: ABC transporter substrate-binding protein [bacterium]
MRVSLLVLLALLALACPVPVRAAASLHAMLPHSVRQAGVVVVGTDATHPPIEFRSGANDNLQGMDIDLARALGRKLGVRVRFVDAPFDTLIPGLEDKRFDIVMSAMRVTPERLRHIDVLDYFLTWNSILVGSGNPEHVRDAADLCGKQISMERRISQRAEIVRASLTCIIEHRGAIEVLATQTEANAFDLLRKGRSVAHIADFPVAAYDARESHGAFEVVGRRFGIVPYGIGVRRDATPLLHALRLALRAVIADGEYAKILRTWRVSAGALTTADIEGDVRAR